MSILVRKRQQESISSGVRWAGLHGSNEKTAAKTPGVVLEAPQNDAPLPVPAALPFARLSILVRKRQQESISSGVLWAGLHGSNEKTAAKTVLEPPRNDTPRHLGVTFSRRSAECFRTGLGQRGHFERTHVSQPVLNVSSPHAH